MESERKRLRWQGYDYTTPGLYYVTVCTQGRRCLFGTVADGRVQPCAAGSMVRTTWESIPRVFPSARMGDFVIMPNHLHCILALLDRPQAPRVTLSTIVRWFKYRTTYEYGRGVRAHGWPRFDRRLWQRGFHDRVLRNEEEHAHASGYIARNPRQWGEDRYHPRSP